jgi:hypothetical protein
MGDYADSFNEWTVGPLLRPRETHLAGRRGRASFHHFLTLRPVEGQAAAGSGTLGLEANVEIVQYYYDG